MSVRLLVIISVILAAFSVREYAEIQGLRQDLATAQARAAADARASVADWLGTEVEETSRALEWLHHLYQSPDGLQRREGLWIDGHPDYTGISTWVLSAYLGSRLRGQGDAEAKQAVETAIRQSDEW